MTKRVFFLLGVLCTLCVAAVTQQSAGIYILNNVAQDVLLTLRSTGAKTNPFMEVYSGDTNLFTIGADGTITGTGFSPSALGSVSNTFGVATNLIDYSSFTVTMGTNSVQWTNNILTITNNGKILSGDGTVAAPSISFSALPTLGLRRDQDRIISSNTVIGGFAVAGAAPINIYSIGDSLTSEAPNGSYQTNLIALLGSPWRSVNKGVSGRTSAVVSNNLASDVLYYGDGEYLIVWAGINSIRTGVSAASVETDLQGIYNAGYSNGLKVVALTVTPFKGYASDWDAGKQTELDALNAWILNTSSNVSYRVDAYTVFLDPGVAYTLLPAYDSGDHLHPNDFGQSVLSTNIFTTVVWTNNYNESALLVSKLTNAPSGLKVYNYAPDTNINTIKSGLDIVSVGTRAGTISENYGLRVLRSEGAANNYDARFGGGGPVLFGPKGGEVSRIGTNGFFGVNNVNPWAPVTITVDQTTGILQSWLFQNDYSLTLLEQVVGEGYLRYTFNLTNASIRYVGALSIDTNSVSTAFKLIGTNGFGSYSTNALMLVASTGATNSTGVNQTAWLTGATGLQLYNNSGTAIWSGTQTISALTPITVQPGGKFTGTSITSVGTHAF